MNQVVRRNSWRRSGKRARLGPSRRGEGRNGNEASNNFRAFPHNILQTRHVLRAVREFFRKFSVGAGIF
jgi:hypothetical protein